MSRPWSRQVIIAIAPERLSALLIGQRLRPRLLDRHAVALSGPPGSWAQILPALDELFAETTWRRHALQIVLSSHYVRYLALAHCAKLADSERQVLADSRFAETFGELAADWEIRVSPPLRGGTTLACGVSGALLAALRASCQRHARPTSIRPVLLPVYNRSRQLIERTAGYLSLIEPGRLTIATFENGALLSVSSRAGESSSLTQLLHEESDLHQRLPGGMIWLADLTGEAETPDEAAWITRRIDAPSIAGLSGQADLVDWGLA